jgi:hypothetical protein
MVAKLSLPEKPLELGLLLCQKRLLKDTHVTAARGRNRRCLARHYYQERQS